MNKSRKALVKASPGKMGRMLSNLMGAFVIGILGLFFARIKKCPLLTQGTFSKENMWTLPVHIRVVQHQHFPCLLFKVDVLYLKNIRISRCFSRLVSNLMGAFVIGILGLFFARIKKCPVTVFNIPALVPLVPGVPAYQAVRALVNGNVFDAEAS